uniref:Uncharacterized protein n=1 Tax=Helianthus annuus TaxID=4232 RepID=A0A251TKJ1_HELAN
MLQTYYIRVFSQNIHLHKQLQHRRYPPESKKLLCRCIRMRLGPTEILGEYA